MCEVADRVDHDLNAFVRQLSDTNHYVSQLESKVADLENRIYALESKSE